MLSIGIGGQIGSGKTYVANQLLKLFKKDGYEVRLIDADQIAWQLYKLNKPVYKKLVRAFGQDILAQNREIDRKKLAAQAFVKKINLECLNKIIHPPLIKTINNEIKHKDNQVKILDAALLFFWGEKIPIDYRILVMAPLKQKIARMKKRGYNPSEVKKRLQLQMKENAMQKSADFVIDNNTNLIELNKKIKNLYQTLKEINNL